MNGQPPDGQPPDGHSAEQPARESAEEHRRRLAAVFGDVLPETTADERDDAGTSGAQPDEWWRAQVPPHHG